MLRKLFNWIFKSQLEELNKEIVKAQYTNRRLEKQYEAFNQVLNGIDVSVDVHEYDNRYSPSWAVISLQGQRTDFIKFVELGDSNIRDISQFLRQYERQAHVKVDASPSASQFLRVERNPKNKYKFI